MLQIFFYDIIDVDAACVRFPGCGCLYVGLPFCRNCSDRVVMLEASVETYKRKLENLGDLKRQMRLLEENNMTYMQNTVSLEEELRKANAARAQLETYKRQVRHTQSRVRKLGCTPDRKTPVSSHFPGEPPVCCLFMLKNGLC